MTLEEAIKHCDEVSNQQCNACGTEHKQLADWLRELKELRADCAHCIYMYGENSTHKYPQEIEVMLRLQERLENLLRECSDKATAIGEEAKEELRAIREDKESWENND